MMVYLPPGNGSASRRDRALRLTSSASFSFPSIISYPPVPPIPSWAVWILLPLRAMATYVEFWGLVNADDKWTRERYIKRMKKKMAQYYSNDIKFISIYPDNLKNLDWIFRTKFKKVTGYELSN